MAVEEPGREELSKGQRRRLLLRVAARVIVVSSVLLVLYFVIPYRGLDEWGPLIGLVLGLAAVVILIGSQIRRIVRSTHPELRAIEALAATLPLFILLFASAYYALSVADQGNFTASLTRIDALYFTVTVLATVGFGDVSADSQLARVLVTVQMLANIALIAVGVKLLVGAARRGKREQE